MSRGPENPENQISRRRQEAIYRPPRFGSVAAERPVDPASAAVQPLGRRFLPVEADGAARRQLVLRGVVMVLIGLCLAAGTALSDAYLHRGIEASDVPPYVLQVSGRGLATNMDLRIYPPEQLESVSAKLKTSGFLFVRQQVSWSDVESQRGTFDWTKYDLIIDQLVSHDITLIAILNDSPEWARNEDGLASIDAPPAEMQDYAGFVQAFVARYGDRAPVVQIWDLPNRADYWGGTGATPAAYVTMLAAAHAQVKATNSDIRVLLAEFDVAYGNGRAGADIEFLRGVYDQQAAPLFDVAAARIDGGTRTPFERGVDPGSFSFSRTVLFREVMVEFADATKPVWLTHYGWDGESKLDRDTQADFMVAGIRRSRGEWPWLGPMFAWGLQPDPGDAEGAARALLYSDGTSTPAFDALTEFSSNMATISSTGFVPVDATALQFSGNWSEQHLQGQVFLTTSETGASGRLAFEGTGIAAFLRRSPDVGVIWATLDGRPIPGWPVDNGKSVIDLSFYQAEDILVPLATGLDDEEHVMEMTLGEAGIMTIGGVVVSREPPVLWPVVLLLLAAISLVTFGLKDIVFAAALRAGVLRTGGIRRGQPTLPRMPDWRPASRA